MTNKTAVVTGSSSGIGKEIVLQLLGKNYKVFANSLPVSGKSGTLRNFCRGTVASGRVKAKSGTLLHATNCSIGVNLFFKLNQQLARLMNNQNEYNVRMEETHHTQKLDAPSGTAITLAEGIIAENESINKWKKGDNPTKNELPIVSHRIENVPGTHQISYTSAIDEITIKHTAHNRKGFALGAVIAAEFIKNKKGIFTMEDVLSK